MGFSPWFQGDRLPVWTFELEPDTGVLDITGLSTSDFTLNFINMSNKSPRAGTGTFSNLTAASGGAPATITYTASAADTATVGINEVRAVLKAGTANQRTFSMGIWECIA